MIRRISCSAPCGKSQRQVRKLIAGPVYICDECIELCNEIIDEEFSGPEVLKDDDLPKPREINRILNEYVIGQEDAKGSLPSPSTTTTSVSRWAPKPQTAPNSRSPTSCSWDRPIGQDAPRPDAGQILNVPFAIADATALTEAGYVGEDVENILLKLIQAADFDVKKAETGIIYIDEIDKVARKADNLDHARRLRGRRAAALLKILEGTVASVPPQGGRAPAPGLPPDRHQERPVHLRRRVRGTEEIIRQRIGKKSIGFGSDIDSRLKQEEDSAVRAPRGPPEVRTDPRVRGTSACYLHPAQPGGGRPTHPHRAEERPGEAVQTVLPLRQGGPDLHGRCPRRHSGARTRAGDGARGLRSILESALLPTMYELPSRSDVNKCVVDVDTVKDGVQPSLVTGSQKYSYDEEESA